MTNIIPAIMILSFTASMIAIAIGARIYCLRNQQERGLDRTAEAGGDIIDHTGGNTDV